MGVQNSVPLAALPKQQSLAAIGFPGMAILSSIFILNLHILHEGMSCRWT